MVCSRNGGEYLMQIDKKLYKNNPEDMAQYTVTAQWCNSNNAHIEDKGSYYEVVANVVPEPTTAEQIAEIDAQYEQDKVQLCNYYTEAVMRDDAELQEEVKSELNALDAQYDLDINAIE